MSGSKRFHDGSEKRKHVTLSIVQKIEIVRKLEDGATINYIAKEYGIGSRTVYDLKKNKKKLLDFFANSDSGAKIASRKTLRAAKVDHLDKVIYEWFKQRRNEGAPITGPILREKAKEFHKELNIGEPCQFSSGWLTRFKQRHGIRYLKACGEKLSADVEAAEEFVEKFSNMVHEEGLSPEQIYNMDETGLFWRCLPRQTLVAADESTPSGTKNGRERVTVVICSNAAGTHKCKPLLIGKSLRPRPLKNLPLPVIYKGNKSAWITKELTSEWFNNYFVPEARNHCLKVGLPPKCKIVLMLDNCAAHPELLEKDNVVALFMPPNTTSLIQPMDQGVIHSFKCHYKGEFLRRFINMNPSSETIEVCRKSFTIKDCVFVLADAWNSVSRDTLVKAWRNLWPGSLFIDTESDNQEFEGFKISIAKQKTNELLFFARSSQLAVKELLEENEITDWMIGSEEAFINEMPDSEIISNVINPAQSDSDTESDTESSKEKISLEEGFKIGENYISFLSKQSYISEQEIAFLHNLQAKISENKYKNLKQTTIISMFNKFKNKYVCLYFIAIIICLLKL